MRKRSRGASLPRRLAQGPRARVPKVRGWATSGLIGSATATVSRALKDLRPAHKPGREERFEDLVSDRLRTSPFAARLEECGDIHYRVDVNESFGKPLLVNFDVLIPKDSRACEGGGLPDAVLQDVLESLTEALWNNPEVAPVAVRGRVVAAWSPEELEEEDIDTRGRLSDTPEATVVMDLADLGFEDEIARVRDLYERFGPPAADPDFHL